jgi:Zn-dependent protease/CBS domain-containing protein
MPADADTSAHGRETAPVPARARDAVKVGSLAGIGVYVHWTFGLLIGWVLLVHLSAGHSLGEAFASVVFILTLFLCVVLHEFGHAFAARRYGIATRDITLLPIGGVARLERMPEKPAQELVVALAGPAVNFVIAALLLAGLAATGAYAEGVALRPLAGSFWERLLAVNLLLAVFNLLPAFPMDGGRVLRAVLAVRLGRRRATRIAARVGQGAAVVLGLLGLLANPFLVVLAVFVFIGARSEAGMVEMDTALEGLEVRAAMMTRFRALEAGDGLGVAVEALLAGSQQDFPVLENGRPAGILRRNDLVQALARGPRDATVRDVMCRDVATVDAGDSLRETVTRMHTLPCATMPVTSDGRLVGLLTFENVSELVVIRDALGKAN